MVLAQSSEFFTGYLVERLPRIPNDRESPRNVDARKQVTVAEYEAIFSEKLPEMANLQNILLMYLFNL